jgi:hypothetical protein
MRRLYLRLVTSIFHIVAVIAAYVPSFNPITSPQVNQRLFAGQYFNIQWTNNTSDRISLLLFFWGTQNNWILADNIPNVGTFSWWISDKIAYPTIIDTTSAGNPYWFEIHIFNGSFRDTVGPGADSYVGMGDNLMTMNRGPLWFNITAPIYSVQTRKIETVSKTILSTIYGGTTETFPITWSTVSPTSNSVTDSPTTTSSTSVSMSSNVSSTTTTTSGGLIPDTRLPTFASINGGVVTGAVLHWTQKPWVPWVCFAVVLGAVAVL